MYLNKKNNYINLLILLVVLFFSTNCHHPPKSPLAFDQIVQAVQNKQINLPVHHLDPKSKYKDVEAIHYFHGDGHSEGWLETYFTTKNERGETIRVARLTTYYLVQPIQSEELTDDTPLPLNWSYGGRVEPCHILFKGYEQDKVNGSPYQSCFFWVEKHYNYKLHTIWPSEEMEPFLDALVEVARPDWADAPPENKPTVSIEDILKKQDN